MTAYADRIARAPRTLSEREQRALLAVTGQHKDGFRDHVIFSLALGTALREHELLALDGYPDTAAEELKLIAWFKSPARDERLAVDRDPAVATDRLREGLSVQQVKQHDGTTAGSRQAQVAVGRRADAEWQPLLVEVPLAFDVTHDQVIEIQIGSSHCTTMGCISISGPTWNSSLTSR